MSSKVIAAAAVLLIGAALFWIIAAGSSDDVPDHRPTSVEEKSAQRIEGRLAQEPHNKKLLLRTMYAWVGAGATRLENRGFDVKSAFYPVAIDYGIGLRAWDRYLAETGGEATRDDAEYAGAAFFSLVEIGSRNPVEAAANAAGAARALRIACRHGGELFNLSNLASYEYFNGAYARGDRAARLAAADVAEPGGLEPDEVIGQLNEYKERGEKFVARVRRGERELEESGEEELDYTIKGYGAPAGINGYEPTAGSESS